MSMLISVKGIGLQICVMIVSHFVYAQFQYLGHILEHIYTLQTHLASKILFFWGGGGGGGGVSVLIYAYE